MFIVSTNRWHRNLVLIVLSLSPGAIVVVRGSVALLWATWFLPHAAHGQEVTGVRVDANEPRHRVQVGMCGWVGLTRVVSCQFEFVRIVSNSYLAFVV